MTHAVTLAAAHSGSVPSPVTIILVVAAIGYVLWSRTKGQPLKAKRLLVLPVVLTGIGVADLPHLSSKDIAFLVISLAASAILGAARGATIELYPRQGEMWQRYRLSTVVLWVALIATKVVLLAVASAAGASAGGGTNSLLVSLGVSLLAEAAVVAPRALSTGLPFAADPKDADPKRSRPSLTDRLVGDKVSRDETRPDGPGEWRSPGLVDGLNWLRGQLDQPGATRPIDERRPKGARDDHHHEHHHEHRHLRDGRS